MIDRPDVKRKALKRLESLRTERSAYISDWRDMSDFVYGSLGRWLVETGNKKPRRNDHLYNESAKLFLNVLTAGMMAGITSPARPWFKLSTPDPHLAEFPPVKEWLAQCERILYIIFARSNFYVTMYGLYREMSVFGQQPMMIWEDFNTVIRCEGYTAGSYFLSTNAKREVDTMYREFPQTVRQLVEMFGLDAVSQGVRNSYRNHDYERNVEVVHCIEPNKGRNLNSPFAQDMQFRSLYMEKGKGIDGLLRFSGFNDKPFISPRWDVTAEDIYASSYPAINSIGTNKSLQVEELDKAVATEKMHNPPLAADAVIQNEGADLVAGGITYFPNMATTGKPGMAPIYDVRPDIKALTESIMEKENRLSKHFYADLFLMITQIQRTHVSAEEIAEKKEEKLLMLGPVLERNNHEGLDPIIDRTFNIADRRGMLPPPPPDIQGKPLKVKYISILQQAQEAIATGGMEATARFIGEGSAIWPEMRHKIDPLQLADEYASARGVPPSIMRDDKAVEQIVEGERQAAAQQQAIESGAAGAKAAKDLSGAKLDDKSVLSEAIEGA